MLYRCLLNIEYKRYQSSMCRPDIGNKMMIPQMKSFQIRMLNRMMSRWRTNIRLQGILYMKILRRTRLGGIGCNHQKKLHIRNHMKYIQ